MSNKRIRSYESFRNNRLNEGASERGDNFAVSSKLSKSTINKYKKKIKEMTDKNANTFASDIDIASELTDWALSQLDNIENVPVSILTGGDEETAQDITSDEVDEISIEDGDMLNDEISDELDMDTEEDTELSDSDLLSGSEEGNEEGGEEEVDTDEDEYEDPLDTEETDELEEETDEEEKEDMDNLPI